MGPKYSFPTVHVSPPPSPIKPLKASPERHLLSSMNGQHDLMQVTKPTTGNIGILPLSEDSESDHEKTNSALDKLDPAINQTLIEKKPPTSAAAVAASGSISKPHHTTSESSSDDSSSEDTSTDEERSNKKSNKLQKGHNSSNMGKGVVPTQP